MNEAGFLEICTPDGNAIKFRAPWDRGNASQWFRTRLTPSILNAKSKARLPILGCWNAGPQKLICVDYDAKTPGERLQAREICDWAASQFPNCVRFSSASGNPRVAFLVQVPAGRSFSTPDAVEYLRGKLPESAWWFDHAGLERLYVSAETAEVLAERVPRLTPEHLFGAAQEASAATSARRVHALYRADLGDTPAALKLWAKDTLRREFLRILTACWGLARDPGFNLSMQMVADNIGCSAAQVSRMLKELQTLGVLSCIDPTWAMGRKARTYRAAGALLGAIQRHRAAADARRAARPAHQEPVVTNALVDGRAYRTLLWGLTQHSTKSAYLAWVQALPGCNLRRLGEAARYWTHHERRRAA